MNVTLRNKLCSVFLIMTILMSYSFTLPVLADDNAKPEVYLMQYDDEFVSTDTNERIELGASAVYGDNVVKTGGVANSNFKIHLNRNKARAVGNIVTEFTIKQSGLMTYGGQCQIILVSSEGNILDLRWRKPNSTSQELYVNGREKLNIPFDENKSEAKITIQYDTVSKELSLWVDDEKKIDKSTTHTSASRNDVSYVYFNSTSQMTISLENFKWYYAEREGLEVQETIFREDFETDNASPESTANITLGTSDVTYGIEKGALKASTSATGGKTAYTIKINSDGSPVTGEYVIEATLHNADGTENSHRFMFGSKLYVNWNPKISALGLAYYNPDRTILSKPITDFGAKGNVLKITAKYNTNKGTVKLWFNDIKAWEFKYTQDILTYTSIAEVKMYLFSGSIELSDFHCYRVVEKPLTDAEKIAEAKEALTDEEVFSKPLENGYITGDLLLPSSGENDVAIEWSISNNARELVNLQTGTISRGVDEVEATLTATFTCGNETDTKDFTFKIHRLPTDAENVADAKAKLTDNEVFFGNLTQNGYLVNDLNLITKAANDVSVEWSISDNARELVDLQTGYVKRGEEEVNAVLTANLSLNGETSEKSFTFKIPAAGTSADGTPAIVTVGRREEFTGYNSNTMAFTNGAVGLVEISDGKLNISTSGSSGSAVKANINLTELETGVKGEVAIDVFMKKAQSGEGPTVAITDAAGNYLTDLRIFGNVLRNVYYDESGARQIVNYTLASYGASENIKLTVKLDTENGLLTLYLNNKLLVENVYSQRVQSFGSVSKILFVKDNAKFWTEVDRVCMYYTKTTDANAARLDAAELNYNDIFLPAEVGEKLIAYDVTLPVNGVRGSEIIWTSSHPEIISSSGEVTRPEADTEVTLTAGVKCGDAIETAVFKVTVLRGGDGDLTLLKKDHEALTLDSILTGELVSTDLISDDLNLYTKGKYGSKITWTTSNSSIITSDGTVTKPANEDGNIYVVLTAKFTLGDYSLEKQFRLGVIPESYSFDTIPLPERLNDVLKSNFKKHTDGGEIYNSDLVGFSYTIGGWSGCVCRGYGGYIMEEDGYVEMVREREHSNATLFRYVFSPLGVSMGGLSAIQYTLTKEGTGEIKQTLNGLNSVGSENNVVIFYWQEDGKFKIRHKLEDGTRKDSYSQKSYTDSVKITIMTDENAGTFSMWVDDDCVLYNECPYSGLDTSIYKMDTNIEPGNNVKLKISDFDIFEAYPVDHLRPVQDSALITEEVLRDGIYNPSPGRLSYDLNLVTQSRYGSTITWSSSREDIISTDGTLTRPLDLTDEVEVTLTAKVSYSCFTVLKDFTFLVQPYYSDDEVTAQKDHDFMSAENWNLLSFGATDFNSVTTSLNLLDKGPYGSTYYWKSSNPSVITDSGRVIRPRWNDTAKEVTMTLITVYGSATKEKTFTFTVLPDEELKDPKHMSDEDFFGVWDGTDWSTEGKINYKNYPDLGKVEAAAKLGDYELAKSELLSYMKKRSKSFIVGSVTRNTAYAEAFTMSNIYDSENHSHYTTIGEITSHDYEEVALSLSGSIIKGSVTSYKVSARYNEKSTMRVLSSEHPDISKRPRAELIVNGVRKVFYASGDTTISGGKNRYTNFSTQTEMPVTYFGEFQGEGLSDMLLQFDFSSIKEGDEVSDSTLYFYAKIDEPYANEKEIVAVREGSDWDASTVTLDNIEEYTFNFNGIPGKNTWRKPGNAESEYILQTSRLSNQSAAVAEYAYTKNEKYAYAAIYDIMDFIIDTQGRFVYAEELSAGRVPSSMDWEKVKDHNIVRYGAYPRALDSALRQKSLINMFDILASSQFMTADICTAILKNLWHSSDEVEKFLVHPDSQGQGANQKIIEAECFSSTAAFMPEFLSSDHLIKSSIPVMENLMANSFYPDGSYIEGSDGYTSLALGQFNSFWEKILIMGEDFSDSAKELLGKANQYVANLGSNGGVSIAWGDNGKSHTRITAKGQDYYRLSGDEITNYINTYGRKGIMPDWTSKLYEGNMLAIMRSDWTDDGTFVFMPSGSLYAHAHYDANQIILNAYRRALLIDPGYFSYTASPERTYVKSTLGHNTVEIDNTSQRLAQSLESTSVQPLAQKHSWVSNSNHDFYSVTNYSNKAQAADSLNKCVEHRRTVTFLKPDIVIVSDLMSPDMEDEAEAAKPHSYKQLWHMSSLADMRSSIDKRQLYSNFPSGAQIKVASADSDASIKVETGIDTEAWGVGSEAKYGYFQKENILGKTTFDTVLMPYKRQGDIKAERISLSDGIENYDATAMKITSEIDGEINYIYYMLDYDHIDGATHSFGGYVSDAELALVRTSQAGKLIEAIFYNGSYINTDGGDTILSAGAKAQSLSLSVDRGRGEIFASDDVVMENVKFVEDDSIDDVYINGSAVDIDPESGEVTPSEKEETEPTPDISDDRGGITDGNNTVGGGQVSSGPVSGGPDDSGASGGGAVGGGTVGGGTVGGGTVGGGTVGGGTSSNTFGDVADHWAEESIVRMKDRGIVQGDGKSFRPDSHISRAELVTMAVRALGVELDDTDTPYADVSPASWYAKYINAALSIGLISNDTKFRPDDLITREEMSKILSGASSLLSGMDLSVPDTYTVTYTDIGEISDWAEAFVRYASYTGLMNGTSGGRFAPKESATRAQVATVIDRMFSSNNN